MNLFEKAITGQVDSIIAMLESMPLDDQVRMLNVIRKRLHEAGPFANEPVDLVEWVPNDQVQGNDYNPNGVAPPEMRLLERSIATDGFTMGIVTFPLGQQVQELRQSGLNLEQIAEQLGEPLDKIQRVAKNGELREVVDGFHRHKLGKGCRKIREQVHGYLPVSTIRCDRSDPKARISATIRHNRARGVHGVAPMTDIVADLLRRGYTDTDVAKELGMDADEVLRFKQNCGLPELFKDSEFSPSWE